MNKKEYFDQQIRKIFRDHGLCNSALEEWRTTFIFHNNYYWGLKGAYNTEKTRENLDSISRLSRELHEKLDALPAEIVHGSLILELGFIEFKSEDMSALRDGLNEEPDLKRSTPHQVVQSIERMADWPGTKRVPNLEATMHCLERLPDVVRKVRANLSGTSTGRKHMEPVRTMAALIDVWRCSGRQEPPGWSLNEETPLGHFAQDVFELMRHINGVEEGKGWSVRTAFTKWREMQTSGEKSS